MIFSSCLIITHWRFSWLHRWITRTIERYWKPLNARGLYQSGGSPHLSAMILIQTRRVDSHSYRFAHILHTIRALQSSTKTSLRIEAEGLLSLQFLVPVPKAKGVGTSDSFIEFRVRMTGASGTVFSHVFLVYAIGR